MRLFITGIGSGLGKALALEALSRGFEVYALSRHLPPELEGKIRFERCDLLALEEIPPAVFSLLKGVEKLDLVILNAGILGRFGDMKEVPLYEMKRVMDTNLWANKVIIDSIRDLNIHPDMIIAISSGAGHNCNRGWNAYSLSKAALNCLVKLYAREMEGTHLIALAPGLVLTPMLEEVMAKDAERFPSIKRIIEAPKRSPEEAATLILDLLPKLQEFESGSYIDVREL